VTSVGAHAQRHVEHCMGTVFSFDLRSPGVDGAALNRAIAWLHEVDRTFSTYRPDSDISRLDRREIHLDDCAPPVTEVLRRCRELTEETDGFFTCNVEGRLDPSGYVKGWAVERASDLLVAAGSRNHCIVGGGDVQCVGDAAPGRPWTVGIADPLRAGSMLATVTGSNLAVATSGTAERGRHIVDPHTGGHPDAWAGVTVVGSRLAEIDAYATAAFAMGERAEDWLRGRGLRALLVRPDGGLVSSGMPAGMTQRMTKLS
jgi:thiamine biosynthesis lipoprotein